MVRDHAVDLAVPGERELESEPKPVKRWVPGADEAHSRSGHPQTPRLVVVLDRLQGDVVAEPLGLLVGVGVAADVDEQGGVIDVGAPLFVEPDSFSQPQRDQALPQDVLHRLPETEVYAERERGHQLRQSNVRAIDLTDDSRSHEPKTIGRAPRKGEQLDRLRMRKTIVRGVQSEGSPDPGGLSWRLTSKQNF